MRHRSLPALPGRCKRCWLRQQWCLCAELQTLPTRTRVVVIRHVREAAKSTNTARLAALVLPNLEIRAWGDLGHPLDLSDLDLASCCLLYPEGASSWSGPVPEVIVVPDGNWNQARRMARTLRRELPFKTLGLVAQIPDGPRLRVAVRPERLTTIEAIAGVLRYFESDAPAAALERAHDLLVRRSLVARGRGQRLEGLDPKAPCSLPSA